MHIQYMVHIIDYPNLYRIKNLENNINDTTAINCVFV